MPPKIKFGLLVAVLVLFALSQLILAKPQETKQPLEQVLEKMDGVGKVELYIHYPESTNRLFTTDSSTAPLGVVVIAEGAHQPSIQQKLRQTVASVLQIPAHRIQVEPMKGDTNDP